MNAKVEQSGGSSFADIAKLSLAILIFLAGIVGFYWFTDQSSAVRSIGLLGAIVIAAAIASFTQQGRALRAFFSESVFELRKVVWPTRDETIRTTGVIIVVVIILSLLLGLIDLTLKWAILDKLLNVGR
jgi:preprotein translocase subunit SecE